MRKKVQNQEKMTLTGIVKMVLQRISSLLRTNSAKSVVSNHSKLASLVNHAQANLSSLNSLLNISMFPISTKSKFSRTSRNGTRRNSENMSTSKVRK